MDEIRIPPDLLEDLKGEFSEPSENGSPGESGILSLERSLSWLVNQADDFCKERDLPGLGKLNVDDYSELTTIVLRNMFGEGVEQFSPEFLWTLTTTGIITSNLIVAKQLQDNQESDSGPEDEQD